MASQHAIAAPALPPDVAEFCLSNGLMPGLNEAINLAETYLCPIEPLKFELDVDYETDDERVAIVAVINLTPEQLHDRYDEFIRRWADVAPPEARFKIVTLFDFKPPA
jgi:hypothetical protein